MLWTRIPWRAVMGATLLLATVGAGSAQMPSPEVRARLQSACRADAQKLCANIKPGGGRLLTCLNANMSQVSPGCQAALSTLRQGQ